VVAVRETGNRMPGNPCICLHAGPQAAAAACMAGWQPTNVADWPPFCEKSMSLPAGSGSTLEGRTLRGNVDIGDGRPGYPSFDQEGLEQYIREKNVRGLSESHLLILARGRARSSLPAAASLPPTPFSPLLDLCKTPCTLAVLPPPPPPLNLDGRCAVATLMSSLASERPADPLDFLVQQLRKLEEYETHPKVPASEPAAEPAAELEPTPTPTAAPAPEPAAEPGPAPTPASDPQPEREPEVAAA
jgi:hypothetical protein